MRVKEYGRRQSRSVTSAPGRSRSTPDAAAVQDAPSRAITSRSIGNLRPTRGKKSIYLCTRASTDRGDVCVTERDQDSRQPIVVADPSDRRFPAFSPDVLEVLSEFGELRDVAAGDVLYRAGESSVDFYVLIEGGIEIVRDDESQQLVLAYTGTGQFLGELGLLTGQRTFLTARTTHQGRLLVIPHDSFRQLMATKPAISDTIVGALIARRETLRTTSAAETVQIIGSHFSPESLALRTFAARNRLAHTWIDLDEAEDVGALLASKGILVGDSPVVITPTRKILRHPTPGEFAEELGLTYHPVPGRTFDLVVIGVDPPASPPRSTEPPKVSTPCPSTRWVRVVKPAPAPVSRIMRDFPTESPAETLQPERRSRPSDWGHGS